MELGEKAGKSPEISRHVVDLVEEEGMLEEIAERVIDASGMREPGRMMEEKREGEEMEG